MLRHLNESAFVSFSPALTPTETCRPKIYQRILVGFETSNITPGCSVQAGSVTFVSGFSPMISVKEAGVSFASTTTPFLYVDLVGHQ